MQKISTVTGEIAVSDLGCVLSHEHILIYSPIMRLAFGEKLFNRQKAIDRAVELLKDTKQSCGVDTFIDGTPIDLGRDVYALQEVSERSGVNILASSGMYITEEHFMARRTPAQFAKPFIAECESGIGDSGIKPAMLKCATGPAGFTEINKMLVSAMAIAQHETGLPLFAHNTHSLQTGYQQIRIFEQNHVNLEKVILGHCSDSYDLPYLLDLAKSGCYMGFDRIYLSRYQEQAKVIKALLDHGCEDKILVSHDYFAFSDSSGESWDEICNSPRTFKVVHQLLFPELKKMGVSDAQLHKFTYDNPKNLFLK